MPASFFNSVKTPEAVGGGGFKARLGVATPRRA
jgi:hypothetical protein